MPDGLAEVLGGALEGMGDAYNKATDLQLRSRQQQERDRQRAEQRRLEREEDYQRRIELEKLRAGLRKGRSGGSAQDEFFDIDLIGLGEEDLGDFESFTSKILMNNPSLINAPNFDRRINNLYDTAREASGFASKQRKDANKGFLTNLGEILGAVEEDTQEVNIPKAIRVPTRFGKGRGQVIGGTPLNKVLAPNQPEVDAASETLKRLRGKLGK